LTKLKLAADIQPESSVDATPFFSKKMAKILLKRLALGTIVTIGVTAISVVALTLLDKAVDSDEFNFVPNKK